MIIGSFTKNEDGTFRGNVRTQTFRASVTMLPVDKKSERSPDFRLSANGAELGAAWECRNEDTGVIYFSLKMDDPSFVAPIYANLVASETGGYDLIWNRP